MRIWLLKDFLVYVGTDICPSDVCDHCCEWGHWELGEILLSVMISFAVGDKLAVTSFAFFFIYKKTHSLVCTTENYINFILDVVFQGLPGIWFMQTPPWALYKQYVAMFLLPGHPTSLSILVNPLKVLLFRVGRLKWKLQSDLTRWELNQ